MVETQVSRVCDSPASWKIVKLVFLKKPDASAVTGTRGYRAIALMSVMATWYSSVEVLLSNNTKQPEGWERLHVGPGTGVDCEHCQVLLTNLLQKLWEWQEHRKETVTHGADKLPDDVCGQLGRKRRPSMWPRGVRFRVF